MLTVDMMPGMRTTGCLAVRPSEATFSPTVNSRPLVSSFHGSGMLFTNFLHSGSKRERPSWSSIWGIWGRLKSYWSRSKVSWAWRSVKSGG